MDRRAVGWAAASAQLVAILGMVLWTANSAGGPRRVWFVGLGGVAVGVIIPACLNLGRALTPTPVPTGAQRQQGGRHAHIRHPTATGVLLRGPGWWAATSRPVHLAVLGVRARREEGMLGERLSGYPRHIRRTGLFLPKSRRQDHDQP